MYGFSFRGVSFSDVWVLSMRCMDFESRKGTGFSEIVGANFLLGGLDFIHSDVRVFGLQEVLDVSPGTMLFGCREAKRVCTVPICTCDDCVL